MIPTLDFSSAWLLILLPFAVLPMLRRRADTLGFSSVAWLPSDPAGRWATWLARACGMLAIAAIVIGLAGPGRSQQQVLRTGSGAQILSLGNINYSGLTTIGPNTNLILEQATNFASDIT